MRSINERLKKNLHAISFERHILTYRTENKIYKIVIMLDERNEGREKKSRKREARHDDNREIFTHFIFHIYFLHFIINLCAQSSFYRHKFNLLLF